MKEKILMTFFDHEKVKKLRTQLCISSKFISKELDVSRHTVWMWETGKRVPSDENIRRIANILKINTSEISGLPDSPEISNKSIKGSLLSPNLENAVAKIDEIFTEALNGLLAYRDESSQNLLVIKALIESLNVIFYIKNASLKFINASDSFFELFNFETEREKIKNKTDYFFFSHEEADANIKEDEQVILTGKPVVNREGYIPGTKKKKYGIISKFPIFDSQDRIQGVVCTITDISYRREYEKISRLLEINLKAMSTAVSIYDIKNKTLLFLNETASNMFGYTLEEYNCADRNIWFEQLHEEDKKKQQDYIEHSSWPSKMVYRIRDKNESIRHIEAFTSITNFMNINCAIFIENDITEKIDAEHTRALLEINLKAVNSAISIYDVTNNQLIYMNGSATKLFGYTVNEYNSSKKDLWLERVFHEDKKEEFMFSNIANWKDKRTYRIVNIENKIRWIETSLTFSSFMGTDSVIFIDNDITERKEIEELREIMEINLKSMKVGVIILDPVSLDSIFANEAVSKILQVPYSSPIDSKQGENFLNAMSISDKKYFFKCLKTRNLPQKIDIKIKRNSGEVRKLEINCSINVFNNKDCSIIIINDVTEYEEIKEALYKTEKEKLIIMENIPGVTYRCLNEKNWPIVFMNEKIYDVLGYHSYEFSKRDGNKTFEDIYFSKIEHKSIREKVKFAIENKTPYVFEYRVIHSDGSVRWLYERGQAEYTENGRVKHLDGVFFDITKRKRLEEVNLAMLRTLDKLKLGVVVIGAKQDKCLYVSPLAKKLIREQSSDITNKVKFWEDKFSFRVDDVSMQTEKTLQIYSSNNRNPNVLEVNFSFDTILEEECVILTFKSVIDFSNKSS